MVLDDEVDLEGKKDGFLDPRLAVLNKRPLSDQS